MSSVLCVRARVCALFLYLPPSLCFNFYEPHERLIGSDGAMCIPLGPLTEVRDECYHWLGLSQMATQGHPDILESAGRAGLQETSQWEGV